MVRAVDVATFILQEAGEMSAMKLQKLVYYSQAWSLVWDERPLFNERIEAWANGPVCVDLYQQHRGSYMVSAETFGGDASALDQDARDTVRAVIRDYGDKSAQWLSDLTHSEAPWLSARDDLAPGERGNRIISHASMCEYYSEL